MKKTFYIFGNLNFYGQLSRRLRNYTEISKFHPN